MKQTRWLAPRGFRFGAAACGLKADDALDVGLIVADAPAAAAGVFTTNKLAGAGVLLSREHLDATGGRCRALVVNAGNSNSCTGDRGRRDARAMARQVARALKTDPELVLVASTGIIGVPMPMPRVRQGIAEALADLAPGRRQAARVARAMLTTDKGPKTAGWQIPSERETATVAGMAKGAGMIGPRMATMLSFLTTDLKVTPPRLRRVLRSAVDDSFNRIWVDGHTSTCDTVIALASGAADVALPRRQLDEDLDAAFGWVCGELAEQIVADGEGATRITLITVRGARSDAAADAIARTVAASPLVRTAIFGGDPNWGRIASAVGYAPEARDPHRMAVAINDAVVFRNGRPTRHDLKALNRSMKARRIAVDIALSEGAGSGAVLCSDLTHEYVTLNAEYHT